MAPVDEGHGDRDDDPHRMVDIRIVGADDWAVCLEANEDARHHQFRLLRGEAEGELLRCYGGTPGEGWGVPCDDVLWIASHVAWHVATSTQPCRYET